MRVTVLESVEPDAGQQRARPVPMRRRRQVTHLELEENVVDRAARRKEHRVLKHDPAVGLGTIDGRAAEHHPPAIGSVYRCAAR